MHFINKQKIVLTCSIYPHGQCLQINLESVICLISFLVQIKSESNSCREKGDKVVPGDVGA